MKLLLDTCVISDIIKNVGKTREKFIAHLSSYQIYITTVTIFEIQYGLKLNLSVKEKIGADIDKICDTLQVLAFCKESAYKTAEIKAYLKEKRQPIGGYDLLIAASALANDMTVVTANINEFSRVDNLKTVNWRK